jgi:hypothetical protein
MKGKRTINARREEIGETLLMEAGAYSQPGNMIPTT